MEIVPRSQQKPYPQIYLKEAHSSLEIIGSSNSQLKKVSIREITIPPGKKILAHFHKENEEVYYLIFGLVMVTVDNESIEIRRFDAVPVSAGQVHSIENKGSSEAVILEIGSSSAWQEDVHFPK
ncbi:MAG: cupin domain-containing protein [Candidatus Wallbacteria bacterium]|nr:cupin domain-containing protein [Candidatus Wallbacteria bacterium]